MILLNNLKTSSLKIDSDSYHFYSVKVEQTPAANGYIDLSHLDHNELKNCLQASLMQQKGLFLISNWKDFEKSCTEELIKKHHYTQKDSWIYLSHSLKNHIKTINIVELLSFDPDQIEKSVKKIFSR